MLKSLLYSNLILPEWSYLGYRFLIPISQSIKNENRAIKKTINFNKYFLKIIYLALNFLR